MILVETLAGFDALALGVIVGSAGLVAGFLWVLIDYRQFDGIKPAANRVGTRTEHTSADDTPSATENPSGEETDRAGPSPPGTARTAYPAREAS